MTRSLPRRTCIGCRRTAPTAELVRVRRGVDGFALGAGPGRGAWLCRDHPVECLDRAERRQALAVALRAPVTSDDLAAVRATLEVSAREADIPREREAASRVSRRAASEFAGDLVG